MINIVSKYGNNTECADWGVYLTQALNDNSDNVVYFPKGEYSIGSCNFSNIDNKTIILDNAVLNLNETDKEQMFDLCNCNNISFIGGKLNGNHHVPVGIRAYNCKKLNVESEIAFFGISSVSYSAGIAMSGDCSYSSIKNSYIHDIKTGSNITSSAIGKDGYIHCTAIGIKTNIQNEYSKHVTIRDVIIDKIGDDVVTLTDDENTDETKQVDGDGIYIIQRPIIENLTVDGSKINVLSDEAESFIKIINPHITNCSKRGIKVSTRAVDIEGGYIDVSSWGPAVDFQFARNCSIKDTFVRNKQKSALAVCWDDGNILIDNCTFKGNMKNNLSKDNKYVNYGIVLNEKLSKSASTLAGYTNARHNIKIRDCKFYDVVSAISTGDSNNKKEDYQSIMITEPDIGFFSGNEAIMLSDTRIKQVDCLNIDGMKFKYGNTNSDIFEANNSYYSQAVNEGQLVNIKAGTNYINPTISVTIKSKYINEDFEKIYKDYIFAADYTDFGDRYARHNDVFTVPENNIVIADGTYISATNQNLTATVLNDTVTINVASMENTTDYIYIPLESEISFDGKEFNYVVDQNTNNSSNVTVTFTKQSNKYSMVDSFIETALNKESKSQFVRGITDTAGYLRVKVKANETFPFSTSFKISLMNRELIFAKNIESRLKELEMKVTEIT